MQNLLRAAVLLCAIFGGANLASAQQKMPTTKPELPKNKIKLLQTFILRIYEGVLFINPTNAEQLLKQDTKKLKYVQNESLTLSAADAIEQKDGEYVFKIGFVASAEPVSANLTFADKDKWQSRVYELPESVNRFKIADKIIGEQKLKFTEKQSREYVIYGRAQPVITTIRLRAGKNAFVLSLDDDQVLLKPKDYKPVKEFVIVVNP